MAAYTGASKAAELSKAEYLKRYLSADEATKKQKKKKKRAKVPQKGLKIVDDDIDWRQMVTEEKEDEEDDDEAPVIAEVIDERPEEVKRMETFRTSNRWRVVGADESKEDEEETGSGHGQQEASSSRQESTEESKTRTRHDSSDASPPRRTRHDSPDASPPRKGRHDSPDISPPRKGRHDSPDVSPPRKGRHDSPDISPPSRARHDSPDASPPRKKRHDSSDSSPPRQHSGSSGLKKKSSAGQKHSSAAAANRRHSDSDQSPPRKKAHRRAASSDRSPPRRPRRGSDSDQSPPRKRPAGGKVSDEDLSPPRRPGQPQMLSGGASGLVPIDVLRREQDDRRRHDKSNKSLEDESRSAQTTFRDKSGKKRQLDVEREEQQRKAAEKAAKDEKYAQWGRGLAQGQMLQQKLEDALQEAQKPLARHRDDEDLDRMLREQEREGDPMAAMLRRKKEKNSKEQPGKVKPRYKGPQPPPNRFNIPPGYRWDGVDRSNGFEQKRYARIADKKAGQEAAYKWSVEDM